MYPAHIRTIKFGFDFDVEIDVDIETQRIAEVFIDGDRVAPVEVREWWVRKLGGEFKILNRHLDQAIIDSKEVS